MTSDEEIAKLKRAFESYKRDVETFVAKVGAAVEGLEQRVAELESETRHR